MVLLSSCIDTEFNDPEKAVYNPGLTANTTIKDLQNLFVEESLVPIDADVIILGTVIANDKTGNYYKSIVIQDSTAAIQIDLDAYELHNKYHVGDLVYIKCNGLFIGDYGGEAKLGSDYQGGIGRVPYAFIDNYLFKSDGGIPIEPKLVSPPLSPSDVNKLILLTDVQFGLNSLGLTYGDAENQVDRDIPLENCDGNSVIIRTSGYADFARDTIASGNGYLTAVLSFYNGEAQLKLRDPNEVVFNNSRCGDVYYHSFVDQGIDDFTSFSVTGSQAWYFDSQYGAVMNGFPSTNEDWLISPAYDLSDLSDMILRFRHTAGYTYPGFENDLKVFVCDDYDGESNPNSSGTWTELTGIIYPASNWSWTDSGDLDISGFNNNPNVYIAFKYTSSSSESCAWEIDNMRIRVN